jgi:UDP-N-acetylmuramoyl-L-alanyl-D-glutamate--2,6-diaminopimelate ligase
MEKKAKTLEQLLEGVTRKAIRGDSGVLITGVTDDSRAVKPGDLFIARRGEHVDSHLFVQNAFNQGAVAAIVEQEGPWSGVWVQVEDSLEAMAYVAANFYDKPARDLNMIAITGSNGKTTCAYLTEALLVAAGRVPGVLGTIEYRCPFWKEQAKTTTPLSLELHRLLRRMKDSGCTDAVMEVSSHALVLKRVLGIEFSSAMFTNLTQDHLDFHESMEAYGAAKQELFHKYLAPEGTAVLNGDDPYVRSFLGTFRRRTVLSFGRGEDMKVRATDIRLEASGTTFTLHGPSGSVVIKSALLGMHNVENLLAASGVAISQGLSLEEIQNGIASVQFIPGRLEPVDAGQDFSVLVDYAHTPDALERVLKLLREIPHRRIITVFGCGGDRDKTKRPQMGRIACEHSDRIFVTSDNPRSEDPEGIVQDIIGGMKGHEEKYSIVLDRREAILSAVQDAGQSDIVLLAGKGHERTQTWADRTVAFDDREVAEHALRQR